jgi:Tol biopolymer transport system component
MATQIITAPNSSQPANNNSFIPSSGGTLNNTGNILVFSSNAFNLTAGDDNAVEDVYLYNQGILTNLTLFRTNGTKTNAPSRNPAISQNGQSVVFESDDNNLSNVGAAAVTDIYLATNLGNSPPTFRLITNGYDRNSFNPSISADGRWIVYQTLDDQNTDLAAGFDGDGTDLDIILYDTVSGSATWVSQISDGNGLVTDGNTTFDHINPSVSGDGRYVVFETTAPANILLPNPPNALHTDVNGLSDIFLFDNNDKSLRLVSHTDTSPTIAGNGTSTNPVISADGRFIVYQSFAENLVVGDSNFQRDIFVYDINTGQNTKVNLRPGNVQTNSDSRNPVINANGNYVAFESDDAFLVNGDTNSSTDVFVWERSTNTISLFSADSSGNEGNNASINPSISSDGQTVAFQSLATNLDSPVQAGFNNLFLADQTPLPTLSIGDVTVNEGNGTATLTVSLSAASTQTVTVNYATADNTATSGSDYQSNSGTLTFNPNQTSQQITVNLIDDSNQEGNETFNVNLSNAANATISDGNAIVTISDNDGPLPSPPSLSINDVTVNEGGGTATLTVSLSAASTQTVTVDYATANNTATSGSDYQSNSGTLTFNPNQTSQQITVNLIDDSNQEGNETFNVNLSNATNATISDGNAIVTISDNDANPLNTPIYRFQNRNVPGTYLFVGEQERQSILSNFPNFVFEGQAFQVAVEPGDNLIALNRFQNSSVPGTYLYAGEQESRNIRQNFPNFIEEGVAFYVYGSDANLATDFYRFQNTSLPGTYLFVGDQERQSILSNFPNFAFEGAAFEAGV